MTILDPIILDAARGGFPGGLSAPGSERLPKYFPEDDRYLDSDIVQPMPNRDADDGIESPWDPFGSPPDSQDT